MNRPGGNVQGHCRTGYPLIVPGFGATSEQSVNRNSTLPALLALYRMRPSRMVTMTQAEFDPSAWLDKCRKLDIYPHFTRFHKTCYLAVPELPEQLRAEFIEHFSSIKKELWRCFVMQNIATGEDDSIH
jgi:hypothetical protein